MLNDPRIRSMSIADRITIRNEVDPSTDRPRTTVVFPQGPAQFDDWKTHLYQQGFEAGKKEGLAEFQQGARSLVNKLFGEKLFSE